MILKWITATIAGLLTGMCMAFPVYAYASLVGDIRMPYNSIVEGQKASATVWVMPVADPGYSDPFVLNGTITFNSGDGQTFAQTITSGRYSQFYTHEFTYANAGNYLLSFVVSALIGEYSHV